jgi:ribosomal protein L37AE/L43A
MGGKGTYSSGTEAVQDAPFLPMCSSKQSRTYFALLPPPTSSAKGSDNTTVCSSPISDHPVLSSIVFLRHFARSSSVRLLSPPFHPSHTDARRRRPTHSHTRVSDARTARTRCSPFRMFRRPDRMCLYDVYMAHMVHRTAFTVYRCRTCGQSLLAPAWLVRRRFLGMRASRGPALRRRALASIMV